MKIKLTDDQCDQITINKLKESYECAKSIQKGMGYKFVSNKDLKALKRAHNYMALRKDWI